MTSSSDFDRHVTGFRRVPDDIDEIQRVRLCSITNDFNIIKDWPNCTCRPINRLIYVGRIIKSMTIDR